MSEEEFVRAHWESTHNPFCGQEWQDFLTAHPGSIKRLNGSANDAASVMAEFTRERLEQIRLIKEERAMLCGKVLLEERDMAIMKRVLARLESALADLKRGMKEAK